MREFYEKSLQKIKSLLKIPTEKEWNVIAKYEGYLSSESLKYISNMPFQELCQKVKEELVV